MAPIAISNLHSILVNRCSNWQQHTVNVSTKIDHIHPQDFPIHRLHMCCQNWPGLTWTPRPYWHTVLTLSPCLAWTARDKLDIKWIVATCRKRTISAPELETSRHTMMGTKTCQRNQKTAESLQSLRIYVKDIGPCNFLRLFPCSLTYLMFPCSLRFFCFVPVFPLPNFPCSLVPQKPLGDPLYQICKYTVIYI